MGRVGEERKMWSCQSIHDLPRAILVHIGKVAKLQGSRGSADCCQMCESLFEAYAFLGEILKEMKHTFLDIYDLYHRPSDCGYVNL